MMAMISAIASQTLRGDDIKVRRHAFNERLIALARAQDILTATSWLGAPILDVIASSTVHQDNRISVNGVPLILDAKRALSLALALHELTTNSIKYGALSVPAGSVSISWSVTDDGPTSVGPGSFRLEWQDRGGPEVKTPQKSGFGSMLIEQVLAADFEGNVSVDFAREGIRVLLVGSLPDAGNQF